MRDDVLLIEDLGQQHLRARTLAAVLQEAGLRPQLAHFGSAEDMGAILALAGQLQPGLVILSILFAGRVDEHLGLATALRRVSPGSHLTLVGPLPTLAWAELLAACPALDSVLRGEAEASVASLAIRLGGPDWQRAVPGLACRAPALAASPPPPLLADLDSLPAPLRDEGLDFATVEASRGCYHACTFCLASTAGRAAGGPCYRLRGITHLADELEALACRGVRLFLFDDEQFLPPGRARYERVAALEKELVRRGLKIAFTIKCRADDVEEGLFRRLQELGLLRAYVGVESGCQASLNLLGKGTSPRDNAEALATLASLGIVVDFRSLLFHPWSTLQSLGTEIGFLSQVLAQVPTLFSFREVEVYPGTALAARLRAEGRGDGPPWPLAYTLADPRAELLRRLSRLVFGSSIYASLQERLIQAWFTLLVERRFEPARVGPARGAQLKAVAQAVNAGSLCLWQEMLAVAAGDIYDAARINERAADWAARLHAACLRAEEAMSNE